MGAWYRDYYLTTAKGEKEIREAIKDPANRADVEKRLGELSEIEEARCHISAKQRKFLEHVLYGG